MAQPQNAPASLNTTSYRATLLAVAIAVVILGLASRRYPWLFPEALGNYPGDTLWATFVFLAWSFLFPSVKSIYTASFAAATSLAVEVSQLFHWPWLVSLRQNPLGRIALGNGFDPIDLLAYLIGVALGVALAQILRPRFQNRTFSE